MGKSRMTSMGLVQDAGPETTYVLDKDDVSVFSSATRSSRMALYENPNYLDEPTVFPYFIVIATLSQIVMYVVWISTADGKSGFQNPAFDQIGGPEVMWLESVSPFSSCENLHYELWRYVTYVWVHADVWHLIANCVMQFFLGASLESVHGWWRVGLLYILGGIAGGFNVTMFTPDVTVVGASGAIYALLGMVLANIWLNWEDMPLRFFRLFLIVLFITNDALMYVYAYDPFTSYVAHAGGFAFGTLAGVLFLRNLSVTRCEVVVYFFCSLLLLGLTAAWVSWWATHVIPAAAISGDRRDTCCTNILRYGLPNEGAVNGDYTCVETGGDSASLYDDANGDIYQVYEGGWVAI